MLCLDVSPQYTVLGSNIGSVYVFGRCAEFGGVRDPARGRNLEAPEVGRCRLTASKPVLKAPLVSAPQTKHDKLLSNFACLAFNCNLRHYTEGPLRFLERFLVETHSGASASKPIVALRLNPDCTRCALAFEDGELEVVEFSMGDGGGRALQ